MNKFLKFLGITLIIIGAILLILPMLPIVGTSMADLADENWYTVGNLALIIIGLISHITLNKKLEY
jgi:hypothetical protein